MTDLEDKLAASVKKPVPSSKKTKSAQSGVKTPAVKAKKSATAKKTTQKQAASKSALPELHPRRIWPD